MSDIFDYFGQNLEDNNYIPDEEEQWVMDMQWSLFHTELNNLIEKYGYDHPITQEFLEDNK